MPISKSTSGHQRPEHVHHPSALILKSRHSNGLPIQKNCFPHTVSQTTICRSGLIPHSKRSTMSQHMIVEYFVVRSVLMVRRWLPELVMRTSSSGRSGNLRPLRRVARRMTQGWEGARIQSGSGRCGINMMSRLVGEVFVYDLMIACVCMYRYTVSSDDYIHYCVSQLGRAGAPGASSSSSSPRGGIIPCAAKNCRKLSRSSAEPL